METTIKLIGTITVGLLTVLIVSFLMSWPVYMLWNHCLVGAVAGVTEVSWLQAWGISVLCGLLFKPNITSSK